MNKLSHKKNYKAIKLNKNLHNHAIDKKNIKINKYPKEIGGRGGLDPIRYGDWEIKGRAIDF